MVNMTKIRAIVWRPSRFPTLNHYVTFAEEREKWTPVQWPVRSGCVLHNPNERMGCFETGGRDTQFRFFAGGFIRPLPFADQARKVLAGSEPMCVSGQETT